MFPQLTTKSSDQKDDLSTIWCIWRPLLCHSIWIRIHTDLGASLKDGCSLSAPCAWFWGTVYTEPYPNKLRRVQDEGKGDELNFVCTEKQSMRSLNVFKEESKKERGLTVDHKWITHSPFSSPGDREKSQQLICEISALSVHPKTSDVCISLVVALFHHGWGYLLLRTLSQHYFLLASTFYFSWDNLAGGKQVIHGMHLQN